MGNNGLKAPTKNESRVIKFMILLGIFSILNFLIYFFQPQHAGETWLYVLLTITILYSILKKMYMWYNYSNISIPEKSPDIPDFKVDILTTYFPGEPYQMTITTLEAINNITYPHTTYLCDEANDPFLKSFCEKNGIIHVTRDNRINAKAGNINNALTKHATGDICVVLDPDHIPEPHFLDSILPHFRDPEIGFVQIVQSYYNIKDTLVARGAAEQTFQFYGPMMMTLNAYGAVNAIGANCVFRRKALDSIGGHAPGLCEDMHTAMLLYSKGWKAVYVPEVLARGLAPSNLTSFFKQQIKWSRGTFDLLVKVYPKIFKKLTGRQKIHYGILPLHYFAGVTSLINFLIPIFSLLFSITPWRGNFVDFILVLLPVAASSVLIRTYIQKWVIEKKERGFHIIGGLLHINSWWIYLLGLFYTIINKNVPYLPTPKENEWNTNYKIVIPNMIIAMLSIFAVIYGLQKDFTPFSILMAGFALFNAFIMVFGIYLAHRLTNQNQILRTNLRRQNVQLLWSIKEKFYQFTNAVFFGMRKISFALLLLIIIISMGFKHENDLSKWENVKAPVSFQYTPKYLGIFHPYRDTGLSDLSEIEYIENADNVNFNIISFYMGWEDENIENFPHDLMKGIYSKGSIPMITWEPWASSLSQSVDNADLMAEKKMLKNIAEGVFDDYLKEFIQILKIYDQPVFLRFAHEFDNPQYPWSQAGNNTPEEFIRAWKHIHEIVNTENANKIVFVWNPWSTSGMEQYYPGDDYVDWIGITLLNYGAFNPEGKPLSFDQLYEPIHRELRNFTRKPVMLAEFGSIDQENSQEEWTKDAMHSINSHYPLISSIVMFNSAFDKNIPENDWYTGNYIDWTSSHIKYIGEQFGTKKNYKKISPLETPRLFAPNTITNIDFKGINYKKAKSWRNNYHYLSKKVLENDLRLMRSAGINTIKVNTNEIYDYNLRKYSKKHEMSIIYQFEVGDIFNFTKDKLSLKESKDHILKKIREFRTDQNIKGYSFTYDLDNYIYKPFLYYQQLEYLEWFQELFTEIKTIDTSKYIILEMDQKEGIGKNMTYVHKHLSIDLIGLHIDDTVELNDLFQFSEDMGISVFISDMDSDLFIQESQRFKNQNIILSNFQDEHYSNWVTFDGLLDISGNPKGTYFRVQSILTEKEKNVNTIHPRILRPSEGLFPGNSARYHAYVFINDQWLRGSELEKEFKFEWSLIKSDEYGNPIAIKKLGSGFYKDVIIPENYKDYRLRLSAIRKTTGITESDVSVLYTPADQDIFISY